MACGNGDCDRRAADQDRGQSAPSGKVGATDVFAEAAIMSLTDLWHPSKAPAMGQCRPDLAGIRQWFAGPARTRGRAARRRLALADKPESLIAAPDRRLVESVPSEARWHRYEFIADDNEREGSALAFGRPLTTIPRRDAAIVLSWDADPLGPGPLQITNANGYAQRRKRRAASAALCSRALSWSATGANADYWLALHPDLLRNVACRCPPRCAARTQ